MAGFDLSTEAPAGSRSLEPGPGAFPDQLPLELGERREDARTHEAGGRPRCWCRSACPGRRAPAGPPRGPGRQVLHRVDQMGASVDTQNRPLWALLKQVWVGLRPVGSADKSGAAEERWLGTEVDSRLSTAQARWLGAMSGRR